VTWITKGSKRKTYFNSNWQKDCKRIVVLKGDKSFTGFHNKLMEDWGISWSKVDNADVTLIEIEDLTFKVAQCGSGMEDLCGDTIKLTKKERTLLMLKSFKYQGS
jgi:hypothetical protein